MSIIKQKMDNLRELYTSQTNAEESQNKENSGTELITRNKVEGSPFTIIGYDGKFILTLGKYRVSEETTNVNELIEKVENKDWELVMTTIMTLIEGHKVESENYKKEINNNINQDT